MPITSSQKKKTIHVKWALSYVSLVENFIFCLSKQVFNGLFQQHQQTKMPNDVMILIHIDLHRNGNSFIVLHL